MTSARTMTVEQTALTRAQSLYGPTTFVTRLTGETGANGYFQVYVPLPSGDPTPIGGSFRVY